ncbi:hypothetical protein QBC43DRAFT_335808 [Cladorrhinum sp. PSN259]|nr:hypothetical protein QBC43DRAFT_335808 [Cladorrhinum sp. PSN259]
MNEAEYNTFRTEAMAFSMSTASNSQAPWLMLIAVSLPFLVYFFYCFFSAYFGQQTAPHKNGRADSDASQKQGKVHEPLSREASDGRQIIAFDERQNIPEARNMSFVLMEFIAERRERIDDGDDQEKQFWQQCVCGIYNIILNMGYNKADIDTWLEEVEEEYWLLSYEWGISRGRRNQQLIYVHQ